MSVPDGPGEGTWSVFAMKVAEERDELRHKLAGEAKHIESLEGLLVEATRERDNLREALRWYVANDDTNDTEYNRGWMEGKRRAMKLLGMNDE